MITPCPDWVDPRPFRNHVRDLICQTGLSWRMVAAHADVAPRAIHALLHGRDGRPVRRLHVSVARALAATSAESIAAAENTTTDIRPVREMVAALYQLGYERHDLRDYLTKDDLDRLDLASGLACSDATRIRVTACYDLLTRPVSRGRRRGGHHAPPTPPVECGQHRYPPARLDRKQTRWTTASSSHRCAPSTP